MQTLRIPQVDGVIRKITLSDSDARIVHDDPPMIDFVKAIRIVDVYPDGTRERVR